MRVCGIPLIMALVGAITIAFVAKAPSDEHGGHRAHVAPLATMWQCTLA